MKYIWPVSLLSILVACAESGHTVKTKAESQLVIDGKIWSSLFQQKAAEYKALCLQAYNIARLRLDESLIQPTEKPKAIITDIDETFLDNSPYAVHRAFHGMNYDFPSWQEWTAKGDADTLTGALSFFNYAASKNVEIFYVTNRKQDEKTGTLLNLQRYHFPYADENHLLLRTDVASKEPRRKAIASNHEILLFLGDNLADFSDMFDAKSTEQRTANVEQMSGQFGKKFIVLPNPNYGAWEDAIYGYRYDLNPAQKDSAIKSNLKTY